MAHKKGAGSSKNGRESHSKRLGIKLFGGQKVISGNIIVRQRGTAHNAGINVGVGKDHTLFALADGIISFKKGFRGRSYVDVLPADSVLADKPVKAAVELGKKTEKAAPAAVEVKAEKAPAKVKATKEESAPAVAVDDLKKIEGIGPKIAEVLAAAGITTFSALADSSAESISAILEAAGSQFASHNPGSWPKQAALAAAGDWATLKTLQDELIGGK